MGVVVVGRGFYVKEKGGGVYDLYECMMRNWMIYVGDSHSYSLLWVLISSMYCLVWNFFSFSPIAQDLSG